MSLHVEQLSKAREIGGGVIQAQCPACAENGRDKKGQHLRVYPDGRFGCCVYPKDGVHRKRIFALVGERSKLLFLPSLTFTVRVASKAAVETGRSVRESLVQMEIGLAGQATGRFPDIGTLGTANSNPRAYAREEALNIIESLKDSETGVPGVPAITPALSDPMGERGRRRMPYITAGGDLVIPFDSPERYHWWKDGQSGPGGGRLSVEETRAEALARAEEVNNGSLF
jgi:hypothetical protein